METKLDYKMITPVLELTFYKDQEEHYGKRLERLCKSA